MIRRRVTRAPPALTPRLARMRRIQRLQDPAREEVEPARSPNQPVPEQCTAELPLVTEMPAVVPHRTEVGDVTDDGELSEPFRPLSMT